MNELAPRHIDASTATPLRIKSFRIRAVDAPLSRPHPTAGGSVTSAPLVLLDLAMPHDVDRAVTGLPGVTVIGLDELRAVFPGF